ncbi:MAG: DUF2155 domain-containing protein [Hyphomonadaceae bacterium]|nr:DUF2155 domain-containing protein [Hyphomonadaceae bacterium]
MIRTILIGALGLGVSAFVFAQEQAPRPGLTELERELFGDQASASEDTEDSELGEEEIVPTKQQTFQQKDTVILRALDKITGRSTDFEMVVGEPKVYGSLRIDLETCFQTPPEEPPESAAFLKITTANSVQVQTMAEPRDLLEEELALAEDENVETRFSGWMFASSPGLNALEHPVYDIWVIACSEVDPAVLNPLAPSE